jgi:nucleoside-diphosphate-sugar epimerase
MSKKVYVVTGGTGFIGSSVVKKIVQNLDTVIVLTRKGSNLDRLKGLDNCFVLTYDNFNNDDLIVYLKNYKPNFFIHCAWKGVGGKDRNEAFQITENLSFTLDSIHLAHRTGCSQWIGLGSQAEYGNLNCKISEEVSNKPTTLYGKSKLATCWSSMALCEALKLKYTWIRVFSTYGVGDDPSWFIPYIINEIKKKRTPQLTKCEQLWDYLNVSDAASAILTLAKEETEGVFNIGSGNVTSLKYVVDTIKKQLGANIHIGYGAVDYRPDQVMHLEADISKILKQTSWRPQVSLEEGIKQIIDSII